MYSRTVIVVMITDSPVSCHFAQTCKKTHTHTNTHAHTHTSIRNVRQAESTNLNMHDVMWNAEIQRWVGFPLSFGN